MNCSPWMEKFILSAFQHANRVISTKLQPTTHKAGLHHSSPENLISHLCAITETEIPRWVNLPRCLRQLSIYATGGKWLAGHKNDSKCHPSFLKSITKKELMY